MFRPTTFAKISLLTALLTSTGLLVATASAQAQVSVRGYTRSNGTYVSPHIRSYPDGNPYNNYSYGR